MLSDIEIKQRVLDSDMIEPFVDHQVTQEKFSPFKNISYGLGSYGYDIRTGKDFKIFSNVLVPDGVIDPKRFDERYLVHKIAKVGESILIPPNSFALSCSLEWIKVPRDILVVCVSKSTYARCGMIVNVTPLEAGWEGNVTLEISNTSPLPAMVYAGEGITQLIFLTASDKICLTSYADRLGKYQNQKGIQIAKV